MKSSIFDFIVYKIIMSVPVSIITNIIFAYMFFIAILTWFPFERPPIDNGRHMIYIIFSYMMAIVPFYLFNIVLSSIWNTLKI